MIDREQQEQQVTLGFLVSYAVGVVAAGTGWFWRFLRNKPLGGVSALIILSFIVIAIFGPLLIAPYDPDQLFPVKDAPAPQLQAPRLASGSITTQSFTTIDFCNANPGACIESDGALQFFEVKKRNLVTEEFCDATPGACHLERDAEGNVQYPAVALSIVTTLDYCDANPGRCVTLTEEECAEKPETCHLASDGARYKLIPVKSDANESPNLDHWLGTDNLGRSVLSRAIYGRAHLALRRHPRGADLNGDRHRDRPRHRLLRRRARTSSSSGSSTRSRPSPPSSSPWASSPSRGRASKMPYLSLRWC